MNNVVQFSNSAGFTRMDNALYEALIAADLPARELRVALAVHRLTAGYNRRQVKVAALYIAKMLYQDKAEKERANVSRAINSLIRQRVLTRNGGSRDPLSFCDPELWTIGKESTVLETTHCVEIAPSTVLETTHIKEINTNPLNLPSEDTVPQQEIKKPAKVSFDGEQFHVEPDVIARWVKTYPRLDIDGEIRLAGSWAADNPAKAKKDWQRFLSGWMRRANGRLRAVDETGVPVDKIIDLYHQTCPRMAKVSVRSDAALRGMIVERWNESPDQQSGKDFWLPFFTKAARRSQVFYRGQTIQPRLEAILSRANFRDIVEAQQ